MTAFGLVTCLVLAQSSAKFFPIDNKSGIDLLEEARYGKALRALEEQPLHSAASTSKHSLSADDSADVGQPSDDPPHRP